MFGVDAATAKAWLGDQPEEEEDCYVWPDNWPTLQLFLTLQTQWRVHFGVNVAVYSGLDHAAAWAAINGLVPRKERAETYAGLTIMERAALPLLNARNKEGTG